MDGREFTLDNAESLLKGKGSGKINKREFKKKYSNIADDLEKMRNRPMPTRSQNKMAEMTELLSVQIYNHQFTYLFSTSFSPNL